MRAAIAFCIAALFVAASGKICWAAGTFEIAPTTLNLSPGESGLLYISNNGPEPVTMQIQPMDWTQDANADVLSPSDELFASPPLLRIPPGQRQIVRVLAAPRGAAPEKDYRLLVSELPNAGRRAASVNVLLQFNIPVFARTRQEKPQAAWSASARNGQVQLVLQNNGPAAVKLSGIAVSRSTDVPSSLPGGLVYVLPGARHDWSLIDDGAPSLQIAARDARSGLSLDADIAVQR
jgi:fimbrial chaperone protein